MIIIVPAASPGYLYYFKPYLKPARVENDNVDVPKSPLEHRNYHARVACFVPERAAADSFQGVHSPGDRVVAVENPGGGAPTLSIGASNTTIGSVDMLPFQYIQTGCTGSCVPSWNVSNTTYATISGMGVLTPIANAITAPVTVNVTATLGTVISPPLH